MSGLSLEGGKAIGYYSKTHLKKLQITLYSEMGKSTNDYYFNNDELFFVYRKTFNYDKPIYIKDSKISKTEENRYYLQNKSIIKWIKDAKPIRNSKEFSSEYLSIDSELKEIMLNFK